ncbi:uncharacterized protein LOC119696108 isoform X2 [Motacilla alba alba]|nr:uncharacterized protein LOC119696108 isoform X2 [Motacilla alba alba]
MRGASTKVIRRGHGYEKPPASRRPCQQSRERGGARRRERHGPPSHVIAGRHKGIRHSPEERLTRDARRSSGHRPCRVERGRLPARRSGACRSTDRCPAPSCFHRLRVPARLRRASSPSPADEPDLEAGEPAPAALRGNFVETPHLGQKVVTEPDSSRGGGWPRGSQAPGRRKGRAVPPPRPAACAGQDGVGTPG